MPNYRVQSVFNMVQEIAKAHNIDCYNGEPENAGIFEDGRVVLRSSLVGCSGENAIIIKEEQLSRLKDVLKSAGIDSHLHGDTQGDVIKGHYLLIDPHQEGLDKKLHALYTKHVDVVDDVVRLVKKGIPLNGDGIASDTEQAAQSIASAIQGLQSLAKELGVSNSAQSKLSSRTGRAKTAAD